MAQMNEELLETKYNGSVFKRLFAYVRPHAPTVAVCLVLVLIVTALELYRPILIGGAIDNYIKAPAGSVPDGLSRDELIALRASDRAGLMHTALVYTGVLLAALACQLTEVWLLQRTGQAIIYTIRQEIFDHVHTLPLRFFDINPVGRIVTRVTNDVESLNQMYTQVLVKLFSNAVLIVGYAVVMLRIDRRLALMCFAFLPVIFALTLVFRTLVRRTYRVVRTRISALNTFLSENISGMKLIQVFAREKEKTEAFRGRTKELYRAQLRELMIFAVFRPGIAFIACFALALILYRSGLRVLTGAVTFGTMYIFTNYIRSFFEPIQELAEQFSTLQNALASAEKIFTVLDEENTISEPENPAELREIRGSIEFRHVWFAYEGEDYVLRDVSFTIRPGEKVAFVGATGAGKSSILNLIGRYYDIQKGEILIDGVDIHDLPTERLRRAIGQVQQDVFIFTGDVKSNIRLLDDTISDAAIVRASAAVNADRFIERLPAGYDEPVTERGATLSAGQRQLLSFARTLAYDPRILVMDEATANIDTETEQLIQQALETLMRGRTTIMVAHRLSTVQHADCIYVMHKGRIRESGTHQELLARDGIYKKLYELQQ
ncbi:MAG: ABC transporter ATP-binding protein [Ruminococcaceae bacterium]|nr:ABC transporter ATP-binding protein [Oscillospiraceae bacterium]